METEEGPWGPNTQYLGLDTKARSKFIQNAYWKAIKNAKAADWEIKKYHKARDRKYHAKTKGEVISRYDFSVMVPIPHVENIRTVDFRILTDPLLNQTDMSDDKMVYTESIVGYQKWWCEL